MARTTASAVEKIISVDTTISLTPFIDSASILVEWLDSQDTDGLLSDAALEVIERWLAAHFYAQRDQQYSQKMVGRSSAVFQGQTAMNLWSTHYGQTAMDLDLTGKLAQRAKEASTGVRNRVGVLWLGTETTD